MTTTYQSLQRLFISTFLTFLFGLSFFGQSCVPFLLGLSSLSFREALGDGGSGLRFFLGDHGGLSLLGDHGGLVMTPRLHPVVHPVNSQNLKFNFLLGVRAQNNCQQGPRDHSVGFWNLLFPPVGVVEFQSMEDHVFEDVGAVDDDDHQSAKEELSVQREEREKRAASAKEKAVVSAQKEGSLSAIWKARIGNSLFGILSFFEDFQAFLKTLSGQALSESDTFKLLWVASQQVDLLRFDLLPSLDIGQVTTPSSKLDKLQLSDSGDSRAEDSGGTRAVAKEGGGHSASPVQGGLPNNASAPTVSNSASSERKLRSDDDGKSSAPDDERRAKKLLASSSNSSSSEGGNDLFLAKTDLKRLLKEALREDDNANAASIDNNDHVGINTVDKNNIPKPASKPSLGSLLSNSRNLFVNCLSPLVFEYLRDQRVGRLLKFSEVVGDQAKSGWGTPVLVGAGFRERLEKFRALGEKRREREEESYWLESVEDSVDSEQVENNLKQHSISSNDPPQPELSVIWESFRLLLEEKNDSSEEDSEGTESSGTEPSGTEPSGTGPSETEPSGAPEKIQAHRKLGQRKLYMTLSAPSAGVESDVLLLPAESGGGDAFSSSVGEAHKDVSGCLDVKKSFGDMRITEDQIAELGNRFVAKLRRRMEKTEANNTKTTKTEANITSSGESTKTSSGESENTKTRTTVTKDIGRLLLSIISGLQEKSEFSFSNAPQKKTETNGGTIKTNDGGPSKLITLFSDLYGEDIVSVFGNLGNRSADGRTEGFGSSHHAAVGQSSSVKEAKNHLHIKAEENPPSEDPVPPSAVEDESAQGQRRRSSFIQLLLELNLEDFFRDLDHKESTLLRESTLWISLGTPQGMGLEHMEGVLREEGQLLQTHASTAAALRSWVKAEEAEKRAKKRASCGSPEEKETRLECPSIVGGGGGGGEKTALHEQSNYGQSNNEQSGLGGSNSEQIFEASSTSLARSARLDAIMERISSKDGKNRFDIIFPEAFVGKQDFADVAEKYYHAWRRDDYFSFSEGVDSEEGIEDSDLDVKGNFKESLFSVNQDSDSTSPNSSNSSDKNIHIIDTAMSAAPMNNMNTTFDYPHVDTVKDQVAKVRTGRSLAGRRFNFFAGGYSQKLNDSSGGYSQNDSSGDGYSSRKNNARVREKNNFKHTRRRNGRNDDLKNGVDSSTGRSTATPATFFGDIIFAGTNLPDSDSEDLVNTNQEDLVFDQGDFFLYVNDPLNWRTKVVHSNRNHRNTKKFPLNSNTNSKSSGNTNSAASDYSDTSITISNNSSLHHSLRESLQQGLWYDRRMAYQALYYSPEVLGVSGVDNTVLRDRDFRTYNQFLQFISLGSDIISGTTPRTIGTPGTIGNTQVSRSLYSFADELTFHNDVLGSLMQSSRGSLTGGLMMRGPKNTKSNSSTSSHSDTNVSSSRRSSRTSRTSTTSVTPSSSSLNRNNNIIINRSKKTPYSLCGRVNAGPRDHGKLDLWHLFSLTATPDNLAENAVTPDNLVENAVITVGNGVSLSESSLNQSSNLSSSLNSSLSTSSSYTPFRVTFWNLGARDLLDDPLENVLLSQEMGKTVDGREEKGMGAEFEEELEELWKEKWGKQWKETVEGNSGKKGDEGIFLEEVEGGVQEIRPKHFALTVDERTTVTMDERTTLDEFHQHQGFYLSEINGKMVDAHAPSLAVTSERTSTYADARESERKQLLKFLAQKREEVFVGLGKENYSWQKNSRGNRDDNVENSESDNFKRRSPEEGESEGDVLPNGDVIPNSPSDNNSSPNNSSPNNSTSKKKSLLRSFTQMQKSFSRVVESQLLPRHNKMEVLPAVELSAENVCGLMIPRRKDEDMKEDASLKEEAAGARDLPQKEQEELHHPDFLPDVLKVDIDSVDGPVTVELLDCIGQEAAKRREERKLFQRNQEEKMPRLVIVEFNDLPPPIAQATTEFSCAQPTADPVHNRASDTGTLGASLSWWVKHLGRDLGRRGQDQGQDHHHMRYFLWKVSFLDAVFVHEDYAAAVTANESPVTVNGSSALGRTLFHQDGTRDYSWVPSEGGSSSSGCSSSASSNKFPIDETACFLQNALHTRTVDATLSRNVVRGWALGGLHNLLEGKKSERQNSERQTDGSSLLAEELADDVRDWLVKYVGPVGDFEIIN